MVLGAFEHDDLPFERLVEHLQPERSLSHWPLFQVMLVLQNAIESGGIKTGLKMQAMEVASGRAKFDLTVTLAEKGEQIAGAIEYNSDLFDQSTIARMVGHYQRVLECIVENNEQRVCEIALLTKAERHQVIVEWNHTDTQYQTGLCVHEMFERQVEDSPDSVALVFEDEQLTYSELNRRANLLAHYLIARGAGQEALIGILLDRSAEMVIAMLGVMKAGAAYVPLDPSYPIHRLAFMIEDSLATLIISTTRLMGALEASRATALLLDQQADQIESNSDRNPRLAVAGSASPTSSTHPARPASLRGR